jgi:hypothetical protein
MPTWLVRTLVAPLLILGVFFVYAYGLGVLEHLIDLPALKSYLHSQGLSREWVRTVLLLNIVIPHFLLVASLSYVFSLVAAKVYGRYAVWLALLAALPVVWIRSYELIEDFTIENYSRFISFATSVFEIGSFTVLLCLGTWLSARELAAHRTPPPPPSDAPAATPT